MAELFGFQITRKKQEQDPKQNFTTPMADDGTTTVAAGGYFGSYLDLTKHLGFQISNATTPSNSSNFLECGSLF